MIIFIFYSLYDNATELDLKNQTINILYRLMNVWRKKGVSVLKVISVHCTLYEERTQTRGVRNKTNHHLNSLKGMDGSRING